MPWVLLPLISLTLITASPIPPLIPVGGAQDTPWVPSAQDSAGQERHPLCLLRLGAFAGRAAELRLWGVADRSLRTKLEAEHLGPGHHEKAQQRLPVIPGQLRTHVDLQPLLAL